MPGSRQIWALHPKLMERISAFRSRVIVIPRKFLAELSVIWLARNYHYSQHSCDIRELFIPS
jgi:hypothetical protein